MWARIRSLLWNRPLQRPTIRAAVYRWIDDGERGYTDDSMCNTAGVSEHRVGPGRISSWTTLIVLVSLLFAATNCFADGENVTSCSDSSSVTIATRAVTGPAFRLGDAARPFGWSTVVSDFNHDGIPDLAIADRT